MRLMCFSVAIFSALISVSTALAEECKSVIGLSKQIATVVADRKSVDQHAKKFCSEYAKSKSDRNESNFGASFRFLSASLGSSNGSAEEVAAKYCSAESGDKASEEAYREYIETIAPGAYPAYQQCLEMDAKDLRFNVNLALPREFHLIAAYVQTVKMSPNAKVKFFHSTGVKCFWDLTHEKEVTIPAGSPAVLTCERADETLPSQVTIVRTDSTKERLILPWQAFDKKGHAITTLEQLEKKMSQIDLRLAEITSQLGNLTRQLSAIDAATVVNLQPAEGSFNSDGNEFIECKDGVLQGFQSKGGMNSGKAKCLKWKKQ